MGEVELSAAAKGMQLIGKYVCYRNSETGGFCWGRIKAEAQVNTVDGKRDAFVLTDILICHDPKRKSLESPRGDRLIQKRMLNLEADVIEKSGVFKDVSTEDLFLLLMNGEMSAGECAKNQKVVSDIVTNGGLSHSDIRNEMEARMQKNQ